MDRKNGTGQANEILRIILTADNHLSAYIPKLSPTRLTERRKRLGLAFRQAVDVAIDRHADLFIQAGDLFDSIDPRNKERDFVAEQLQRLQAAGVRPFGVSGNHDTPRQRTEQGGLAPQSIYARLSGMHFFPSSDVIEPVLVEVGGIQVALAGLSYHPHVPPGGDPLDSVQVVDPEGILARADLGILILHSAIEGHAFPGQMEIFARRNSLLKLDGFHLILTGHVHAYDRFSVGNKDVVVCGATELMEFSQHDDDDKVGFVYLELTRNGLQHAEHLSIQPQPRHIISLRTTELWPRDEANGKHLEKSVAEREEILSAPPPEKGEPSVTETLWQKVEPYCTEDAMVRLILEGPLTREQYHELELHSLWLQGQQRAFSFEIDESHLFLSQDLVQGTIERGDRIAPREMLEAVVMDWMEQAEAPAERLLLSKMRQRVLDRYDEISGREASR
ncbi:MAG TPA: metallophosphoesterase [Ktedonobacteraceae bacterium]|nr:metallophosphoesterase [Ktedonobacteraceae bacterium]